MDPAGPGTGLNRRGVDLAAPGVGIRSTGIYYVNPRYPDHNGTSVAAAYLSGAAALLLAIDSSWTPQEIHVHLNESADRPRSLQGICNSEGRLNLRRAVCGPFQIVAPAGGLPLPGGVSSNVQWTLEYPSTIMTQAEISVRDAATKNPLGPPVLAPAASLVQPVPIPSAPGTSAFIRVRGVRGNVVPTNLYTDSDVFLIST
jgi:subtilisin family serine protease